MSQQIGDANTLFGFWTSRQADLSLSVLREVLDRHNITFACTMSTVGIFYDFVQGNREVLEASAADSRLLPVGTVDPRRCLGGADEVAGARERGLRMFSLFPETQGWQPQIPQFRELAEQVAEERLPLMIECGAAGTATQVLHALDDLDLPVILSGVRHSNLAEVIAVMRRREKTYLETHALASTGSLEAVAEQVGADRLLFGSRSPLCCFSSAYLRLKYAGLEPDEIAAATGGNLAALLEAG